MKRLYHFIPLGLLLLCGGSLATLLYLTHHYFDLKMGLSSGDSICHINAFLNCNVINASSYAELFSVPMAFWGFVSHLLLLGLLLTAHFKLSSFPGFFYRMAFWLSGFHLAVSMVMAGISFFILRHLCPFCLLTYIFSLLLFLLSWAWNQKSPWQEFSQDIAFLLEKRKRALVFLLFLCSVPAAAFIGSDMIFENKTKKQGINLKMFMRDSLREWKDNPVFSFDSHFGLSPQNPRHGSSSASSSPPSSSFSQGASASSVFPFRVVEFVDPLCPHCKKAHEALYAFASSRPKVHLLIKFFPLDSTCNKSIKSASFASSQVARSCLLTQSIHCVEKLYKKGWKLHHWIFEHQKRISSRFDKEKIFLEISKRFNLSHPDLIRCVESEEHKKWIETQVGEGEKAGVRGTPTVYVNGKKLPYGQNLYVLKALYERLLPANSRK